MLYVGCERIPGFTLHAIYETCKSFHLIILNVFKYKMSRFLQFWSKLNTRGIVKTCLFRFLRDYFCVIITVIPSMLCFPSFLIISYRFSWFFRCFHECFYDFLGCFHSFPSVFPPFSVLDFAFSCNNDKTEKLEF